MNSHLKLIIYLLMIVAIFLFVQDRFNLFDVTWKDDKIVLFENSDNSDQESVKGNYVEIQIPNGLAVRVDVEIADSDVERSVGLSNRRYLGDYEGMLFIFDNEVQTPFWMKDMLIPLDILFIDSQGYIVDMALAQQPCVTTSCSAISSSESFQYVLEVNSGFCEENDIEEGYLVIQYLE
jgi:uncharacterized membrane protein (UPF0127 family)